MSGILFPPSNWAIFDWIYFWRNFTGNIAAANFSKVRVLENCWGIVGLAYSRVCLGVERKYARFQMPCLSLMGEGLLVVMRCEPIRSIESGLTEALALT